MALSYLFSPIHSNTDTFLHLSLSYLPKFHSSLFYAAIMNKLDTYTACQQALKKYISIWNLDGLHLWPIANQVHSYLRFAEIASKCYPTLVDPTNDIPWYYLLTNDNDDKLNFVENFYTILDDSIENGDPWVDDYGWCGLACISVAKAYKEQNITSPING